MIIFIMQ